MKPNAKHIVAAALLALSAIPQSVLAGDAEAAYEDIRETYGSVPGFFYLFARDGVVEAWKAFKALQLNPDIGMDAKTRELVGAAVAAGGDCQACVYFHAAAAFANGASQAEISEAAALGAATKRLHRVFDQAGADQDDFRRETDLVLWGDPQTVKLRSPAD
jgi:AhpD family alkylhydroperoxidase